MTAKPPEIDPEQRRRLEEIAARAAKRTEEPDELRPEYDFDYAKSRPNRFADRMREGTLAVVLDPDVASVFRSSEDVNTMLRSVLSGLPKPPKRSPNASKHSD